MANSAGLDVEFLRPLSFKFALNALFAEGWTPLIDGCIQYLPPGTKSRMDWERRPASCWPVALEILEENNFEGNANSLWMRFSNTLFVAVFEFFPGGDITVDCGPLRPRLESYCDFTDTSWLMAHIAAPLANAGAVIDKVCFSEIRLSDGRLDH